MKPMNKTRFVLCCAGILVLIVLFVWLANQVTRWVNDYH